MLVHKSSKGDFYHRVQEFEEMEEDPRCDRDGRESMQLLQFYVAAS